METNKVLDKLFEKSKTDTGAGRLRLSGIVPLTEDEEKMEAEVLFGENASWGRHPWIKCFVKNFMNEYELIQVRNHENGGMSSVMRYVNETGTYIVFNEVEVERQYRQTIQGQILTLIDKLLCKYFLSALNFENIWKYKKDFEDMGGNVSKEIYAYVQASAREVPEHEFDMRRNFMLFENGTLDLSRATFSTGFRSGRYCMAKNANVYAPDDPEVVATTRRLFTVLKRMFCEDRDTLDAFLKWVVKCLIPGNGYWRSILILQGSRRNGKSLLQKILEHAFKSPYLLSTLPADLFQKDPKPLTTYFEHCTGEERVLLLNEFTFDCTPKALALLKSVTGGDRVTYRKPYERSTSCHFIYGQVWMTTNATDGDLRLTPDVAALIDRVKIFPMRATFVTRDEFETRVANDAGEATREDSPTKKTKKVHDRYIDKHGNYFYVSEPSLHNEVAKLGQALIDGRPVFNRVCIQDHGKERWKFECTNCQAKIVHIKCTPQKTEKKTGGQRILSTKYNLVAKTAHFWECANRCPNYMYHCVWDPRRHCRPKIPKDNKKYVSCDCGYFKAIHTCVATKVSTSPASVFYDTSSDDEE